MGSTHPHAPPTHTNLPQTTCTNLHAQQDSWGTKIKLEPSKPILGLAVQQYNAGGPHVLAVLHSDGVLRGFSLAGTGDGVTGLVFQVTVFDSPQPKGLPAPGTLVLAPHPAAAQLGGGLLVLAAARLGAVCVAEVTGRAAVPAVLLRTRMQGWAAVLGMGLHQVRGRLRLVRHAGGACGGWHASTHARRGMLAC